VGKVLGQPVCVDALLRPKKTETLDGHTRDARFATLADAITANPKRRDLVLNRNVLFVDDVMTSGATLAAGSEA
jgi:predicted amidophosphoribosyltransferase